MAGSWAAGRSTETAPSADQSATQCHSRRTRAAGELRPAIKREHVNRTHFEQCFDDNRVEHPVQWCKDRQTAKNAPMSWLARPLCGGADGRLAPCEDEG